MYVVLNTTLFLSIYEIARANNDHGYKCLFEHLKHRFVIQVVECDTRM